MKNIGKTIDRILKVDPGLEPHLIPIKNKWERYPGKDTYYWKQVLNVLNTKINPESPNRSKIQEILITKHRKIVKERYSFEPPTQAESIVGIIPEYIEERLKKYDRRHIDLSKLGLEANLTHNTALLVDVNRKMEILDIKQKSVWTDLKDHFNLWNVEGPVTFLVRKKDNSLVLTAVRLSSEDAHSSVPAPNGNHSSFLMKMDPDLLKRFFKYLNLDPPPGLFPE